jgi:ureidoacrylate peracid hydrolase
LPRLLRGDGSSMKEQLNNLRKKADPGHTALIVIDVQNDFCAKEGAYGKMGLDLSMVQEMVPRLAKFIDEARRLGFFIVFVRNNYNSNDNWYLSDTWLEQAERRRRGLYVNVPMCVPGSWGADFYLVRPLQNEPIVTKHRFDAFESSDLDLILRSRGIRTLLMTGFATNVCVDTTSRHGFVKDYYVVILKDLVASDSRELHEASLKNLETYFGQVVGSNELLQSVDASRKDLSPVVA